MNSSTFYFVIIIMVLIDIAQSRYQKKLALQRQLEADSPAIASHDADEDSAAEKLS